MTLVRDTEREQLRVRENVCLGLERVLGRFPGLMVIGEDITDPYGGAFKTTKGLSSRYPDQVLATPISESAIVGVGAGLALAGRAAIVEIMFGDFITLCFDQLVNFAAKSVTMYGRRVPMPLLVRCATGGGRGYGATHSQSLQKHFVGVPGLALYELSAFHDAGELFTHALASGVPSIIFENKLLYGRRMHRLGTVDRLFRSDTMIEGTTQVGLAGAHAPDVIFVAPGFTAELALQAARTLLTLHEVTSRILVPSRLYPVPVESLLAGAAGARHILVVEEGTAGGTWGAEVAHRIHTAMWGSLAGPVRLVHGRDAIIPAAPHLEKEVLVSDESIVSAALEALRHG